MKRAQSPLWVVLAAMIASCGGETADEAPAKPPVEAKAVRPPHCFFKDGEAKGWTLRKSGDRLVVAGRAYRSDSRYKTIFLEPVIEGRTAILRPSIALNDTGFATEDNWWDITATLPAAAIDSVEIRCGKAVLDTLAVKS